MADDMSDEAREELAARISESYLEHYFAVGRDFSARHYESLRPAFRRYFGALLPREKGARILDVACGCGEFLYFLQTEGYTNTTGVDIAPRLIEVAARAGVTGVELGDARKFLTGRREEYDLISVHDFLEHLPRAGIVGFLDTVHAALRPGGRVLVSTPNAESLFGARTRYTDFTHTISFTPDSLAFVLRTAGFVDVRVMPKEPVVHGVASAARFVLWKLIKQAIRLYFLVATGSARSGVFTDVMCAVAVRPGT